jgi:hypothetical protein
LPKHPYTLNQKILPQSLHRINAPPFKQIIEKKS